MAAKGRSADSRSATDEVLAGVVSDENQRGVFRDIMRQVAKRQSAAMTGEERTERAKLAAEARWGKKR